MLVQLLKAIFDASEETVVVELVTLDDFTFLLAGIPLRTLEIAMS